MTTPTRPILRYHGGKWMLAEWIISYFPAHRIYVEAFGGAASVLLQKERSYAEVYNELSDDVVNLFRVVQDSGQASLLLKALKRTPFARAEFEDAYTAHKDPVERARSLIIRSFMGFGSNGHNIRVKTGFRANATRSGTTPAHDWPNYRRALPTIMRRLEGVTVEHRDAVECMRQHDGPETLHYVDPPYMMSTRPVSGSAHRAACYDHEMSDAQHAEMLAAITGLCGYVVLSGYPHPLYDEALGNWHRIERVALADGARERTEVLWINPTADAALHSGGLFTQSKEAV